MKELVRKRLGKGVAKSKSGFLKKSERAGNDNDIQTKKQSLRKNLLSAKPPEEGGYDADAEMLDDIVKRLSKAPSSQRTSIHTVEWKDDAGNE